MPKTKTCTQAVYILVRHTAFSENDETDFKNAVEARQVELTPSAFNVLISQSIPIYSTQKEANQAVEAYCYPLNNKSLIPKAKGRFLKIPSISHEEIFKPYSTPTY